MKPSVKGNMANQKYDAAQHMQRHLLIISDTKPSIETTRWREPTPNPFIKQTDRMISRERKINNENKILESRLNEIINEDRRSSTQEYAPGWRVGIGGTCIDCYPGEAHPLIKKNMEESNRKSKDFKQMMLNRKNQEIHDYVFSAQSSYPRDKLEEMYQKNREKYNQYVSKTPNTALHLGLVDIAKKNIAKKKQIVQHLRQDSSNIFPIVSPPVDNYYNSPMNNNTPSRRPKSAPTTTRKASKQPTNRPMTPNNTSPSSKLPDARGVQRHILLKNKGWDDSTNDNLLNSDYNKFSDNKNATIYNTHQMSSINYLNSVSNAVLMESARLQTMTRSPSFPSSAAIASSTVSSPFHHRPRTAPTDSSIFHDPTPVRQINKVKSHSRAQSSHGSISPPSRISSYDSYEQDDVCHSPSNRSRLGELRQSTLRKVPPLRKNVSFGDLGKAIETFGGKGIRQSGGSTGRSSGSHGGSHHGGGHHGGSHKRPPLKRGSTMMSDLGMEDITDKTYEPTQPEPTEIEEEEPVPVEKKHELSVVDVSEANKMLEMLCLQFKSKYDLPIRSEPINQTIKFMQPVDNDNGMKIEMPVSLTIYDIGYEFQISNPEVPFATKNIVTNNVKLANLSLNLPDDPTKPLRTSTGLLVVAYIDIPPETLPGEANPKDLVSYQYFTLNEIYHMAKTAETGHLRNFVNEMLNFAYPYSGKTAIQASQGNERGKGKNKGKMNKFKMMSFEQVVLVDQDQKRAMIYYCLADMVDLETLQMLLELIKKRVRIQCEPWPTIRMM